MASYRGANRSSTSGGAAARLAAAVEEAWGGPTLRSVNPQPAAPAAAPMVMRMEGPEGPVRGD